MKELTPEIIYEDENIVAINKPAMLVVHSDGRKEEPTVAHWFLSKYPETLNIGEEIELSSGKKIIRPGIVHRIDRETSGILLLAKNKIGFECLKAQFKNREIEKKYHLFVEGQIKEDRGTINLPIGRSSTDFRKWSAQRGKRGVLRDAITYFEVIKRSPKFETTFVEAKPKTGRTHQIRVHFQALQRPVVGDPLYGTKKISSLGFKRLALHAREIRFKNVEGEEIHLTANYPEDFKKAMDIIGLDVLD